VKIRLWGTVEECREAVDRLRLVFNVVSVSEPYADRRGESSLVRVFVETRPEPSTERGQDSGNPP
jgi:hypothetical protein